MAQPREVRRQARRRAGRRQPLREAQLVDHDHEDVGAPLRTRPSCRARSSRRRCLLPAAAGRRPNRGARSRDQAAGEPALDERAAVGAGPVARSRLAIGPHPNGVRESSDAAPLRGSACRRQVGRARRLRCPRARMLRSPPRRQRPITPAGSCGHGCALADRPRTPPKQSVQNAMAYHNRPTDTARPLGDAASRGSTSIVRDRLTPRRRWGVCASAVRRAGSGSPSQASSRCRSGGWAPTTGCPIGTAARTSTSPR